MSQSRSSLISLLLTLPWWVYVLLAITAYPVGYSVLPEISFSLPLLSQAAIFLSEHASYIAGLFLLLAPFAFVAGRRKKKLRYKKHSVNSIRALHWREFERLVAATYRCMGYQVAEGDNGADGGVDLRLSKSRELLLVQCKQWKTRKVGVSIVREMFGILAASEASHFIIVTSGEFTQQAQEFAAGKPVTLINGNQFAAMVYKTGARLSSPTEAPLCPRCKSKLITRKDHRGHRQNRTVLHCSANSRCGYTLSVR